MKNKEDNRTAIIKYQDRNSRKKNKRKRKNNLKERYPNTKT